MLAYSGAGVVLYTFDDATDGHMCLLLLEEVGVGSHCPSRHRWRDPRFKNGNQLTLSLPGGQLHIKNGQQLTSPVPSGRALWFVTMCWACQSAVGFYCGCCRKEGPQLHALLALESA